GAAYIVNPNSYGSDVDGSDDASATARLLASEVYANCDTSGDCTSGTLMRQTYERYEGEVLIHNGDGGHPIDNAQLVSTRTVYRDDLDGSGHPSCGGSDCYTQTTFSNPNELAQYRTTTAESNFPASQSVTTTTQYPSWSSADQTDPNKL